MTRLSLTFRPLFSGIAAFRGPAALLGAAALLSACIYVGEGKPSDAGQIYFPVGLAVTQSGDHLLIVNSDFDLQFAQGTLQSLKMDRLRELAAVPCSADADCEASEICDTEPSPENDSSPSYFCVDAQDPVPCGDLGVKTLSETARAPGRCQAIELKKPLDGGGSLIEDFAETSAFATDGLLLSRPCQDDAASMRPCTEADGLDARMQGEDGVNFPQRLLVPIRGDTSVNYIDVTADGHFVCGRALEGGSAASSGKEGEEARCSSAYRIDIGTTYGLDQNRELIVKAEPPDPLYDEDEEKKNKDDPLEEFRLQPEPFDIAASKDGRLAVVSHQVRGRASALLNSWLGPPELIIAAEGLPERPIGVAVLPSKVDFNTTTTSEELGHGVLMTYRSDARVDLLRLDDDRLLEVTGLEGVTDDPTLEAGMTFRPKLTGVGSTAVTLNALGTHSRGVAVDDTRRKQAVLACAGDAACLEIAEQTSLDVYVANRTPNSLLVGRTGGADPELHTSELPTFHDTIPLTAGPSRVVLGPITDSNGDKQLRVFIICFDSALIYVYNPQSRSVESVIRTGLGPHSIAFDPESSLAFVAHFTDSYIGIVSLDQAHPGTFGAFLATVGVPVAPRASK